MNRENVIAEWRRGRQSLCASELLMQSDYREDAVSRAYYAILHSAKAALFVHDVEVASHASVRRMFGLHLVRTGEVEREWARCLAGVSDDRLTADYNVHTRFTSEETRYECRQAREFMERIERYLLEKGLTDEELGPETDMG